MCGRFTLRAPGNLIIDQFNLDFQGDLVPRYNIAPTQLVPVVRGMERSVSPLAWGLVPFWAKSPKSGARMINARSETVSTKPSFRNAFKKKRCLVPADGYFEWVKEGKKKRPFWIRMQDDRPFLMAGLWERWRDKSDADSEALETFTILTTSSNSLTKDVHDRMPVILSPNDYDCWLDPQLTELSQLEYLFEPFDPSEMQLTAVSDRVNSVRHDDEECIAAARTLF